MSARALVIGAGLMVLAGCGGVTAAADTAQPSNDARAKSEAAAESCSSITAEYSAALGNAFSCDPSDSAACSVQRPLASIEVFPDGHQEFTSLCYVAYVGYVSPSQTGPLDAIISRYKAAGCTIGYCPGPPPGTVAPGPALCQVRSSDAYSCN